MKAVQKLIINGKPIPEGLIINKWFAYRFNSNKNVLACILGGTGTAKSYSSMRICELWYKYRFKESFPQENICFSIKEAMNRIKKGNLRKGEFVIVEEAGVLMNSLEFQNRIQKFFGWVLQSFRCKNVGIIFNLPSFNMLNKTARILLHAILLTRSINQKSMESNLQLFFMKTNYITGEQRPIYFRHDYQGYNVKIKQISLHMPSKTLREGYEVRKNEFVDKTEDNLISEIEREEVEKELKMLTPLQKKVVKALKNSDTDSLREIVIKNDESVQKEQIGTINKPIKDAEGKITGYEEIPIFRKEMS